MGQASAPGVEVRDQRRRPAVLDREPHGLVGVDAGEVQAVGAPLVGDAQAPAREQAGRHHRRQAAGGHAQVDAGGQARADRVGLAPRVVERVEIGELE
jgi:hypothetical protein